MMTTMVVMTTLATGSPMLMTAFMFKSLACHPGNGKPALLSPAAVDLKAALFPGGMAAVPSHYYPSRNRNRR